MAPRRQDQRAGAADRRRCRDEELRAKTDEFRERLAKGETLDDLLDEAFAVVREAAKRTLGQRHYDVQLVGGMVLHKGGIAEMRTGEGKTLVATAPVYLNALEGKGVHVITVNDYLAQRDAEWMGQVYRFLGLTRRRDRPRPEPGPAPGSLRLATSPTAPTTSSASTTCATTWSTTPREMVQRGHNFAIVDEVDSILIDEARTPLIISGPTEDRSEFYRTIDLLVKELIKDPDDLRPRREAAAGAC